MINIQKLINNLAHWLLEALKLQLFLNLISFIILIHWGMPISILSPIGNIIFGPFIIIFLILSSLVFFCEILTISNYWLVGILEIFTEWWLKLLSFNFDSWKISFAQPPFIISILIVIFGIIVLKHKKIPNNFIRIVCLILIFIFLFIYTKLTTWNNSTEILKYRNEQMLVILENKKITLHDKGLLEKASWYWIQYELVPYLIKKFGHNNVYKLILDKINNKNKQSIKLLSKKCNILNIIEKNKTLKIETK